MKTHLGTTLLSTFVALSACSVRSSEPTATSSSAVNVGPISFPGVYSPSSGTWFLSKASASTIQSANSSGTGTTNVAYGSSADLPVVGHWVISNTTPDSIGVFRPASSPLNTCSGSGEWLLRDTNTGGGADDAFCYGAPGDWTGTDATKIGVFRPAGTEFNTCPPAPGNSLYGAASGQWLLRNSNNAGNPDISFCYGAPGDVPVTGDWDGNGTTTIGVFRPAGAEYNTCAAGGAEWLLRNSNDAGDPDIAFCYGGPGDVPVTGDWNNDGVDSIGVFRAPGTPLNPNVNSLWLVRDSNSAGNPSNEFYYGGSGVLPVSGNWFPPPPPPPPPCVPTQPHGSWTTSPSPLAWGDTFTLTAEFWSGSCEDISGPITLAFESLANGQSWEEVTYSSGLAALPNHTQFVVPNLTLIPDGFRVIVIGGRTAGNSGVAIGQLTPDITAP